MTIQANVAALKQHLEQLFPGKWISGKENPKALQTGLTEIDQCLSRGLARQRITEWTGYASSGKTTLLRAIIANWCASGFDVAYIDTGCKLLAADWSVVDQGRGRFWVVRLDPAHDRPTSAVTGMVAKPALGPSSEMSAGTGVGPSQGLAADTAANSSIDMLSGGAREPPGAHAPPALRRSNDNKAYLYIADQLIRSNAFDVIILDLGNTNSLSSRIYARLQRSLARAKAALIITRDGPPTPAGWGCHSQLSFRWGDKACDVPGLNGVAAIVPSVSLSIWKDGLSKNLEVTAGSHVSNRLFTHSPVPDRRTPKA